MNDLEIKKWFIDWCKKTKRNGGVLIGSSITELLIDFEREISETRLNPPN